MSNIAFVLGPSPTGVLATLPPAAPPPPGLPVNPVVAPSSGGGSNTGVIAGIVVAIIVAALVAVCIGVYCFCKKKKRNKNVLPTVVEEPKKLLTDPGWTGARPSTAASGGLPALQSCALTFIQTLG